MSRNQQTVRKRSPTDEYAKKIAAAISKGRAPLPNPAFELFLQNSPGEIFAAFEGVVSHLPPNGTDETLALGYLFLLQQLLERLRYRTDEGHADAAKLIADFQAEVSARAKAGQIDDSIVGLVGRVLHQSRIPAAPELASVTAEMGAQVVANSNHADVPAEFQEMMTGLLGSAGGNSFVRARAIAEMGHTMPAKLRGDFIGVLARVGGAEGRAVAVLFLLDPDKRVRRMAATMLADVAGLLSPVDVRRLIAMRNWRAEKERAQIDAIVRKARAAGIDCAQWEPGGAPTILSTGVDGSGTQGFLIISPAGRKKQRLSSILTKGGIADAWSGEPESARRVNSCVAMANTEMPTLSVSRTYLDRVVADQLAVTIDKAGLPPFGLLQVAETLGGADWQPARMDFAKVLAGLLDEVPESMRRPGEVEKLLRNTGRLDGLEALDESWFEDGPEITAAIPNVQGANRGELAAYLLQSVLTRHRNRWAELFLRTALWMHEAPPEDEMSWRELVLVAKAVAEGRDASEIGLMRAIAERTVDVLVQKRLMQAFGW